MATNLAIRNLLENRNLVGRSKDAMLDHIFECHDEIKELRSRQSQWISVDERLPDFGFYLVYRLENPYPTTRHFDGRAWTTTSTVTHWMPLPENPVLRQSCARPENHEGIQVDMNRESSYEK